MTIHYKRQALLYILSLIGCSNDVSAFTSSPRSSYIQPIQPSIRRNNRFAKYTILNTKLDASIDSNELNNVLENNKLESILSYLESNPSSVPSLSNMQLQSIFNSIELATTQSEENTVNKRTLQDSNISAGADIEFQVNDIVRTRMTKLYRLLREKGKLNVFGAIGRAPPASISLTSQPDALIYPTSGSKIIPPMLLEQITEMQMVALTPKPTNLLLYGGGALAVFEGLLSLYYGISFNLLVVCTLLLALMDQLLVSGAVFETALRFVKPETTKRITKHEAGHFLCAYILGCPVEGVVLSTWEALNDSRFGGRASAAVSAGTSYYDLDLSEQIAGVKPLTRESIDRYSIIVMGGIAAEAVEFGGADGGAGDEEALVRFLRSLNPRSSNAVSQWSPELIRNQARWGATQAVLLLKEYKPCYDALVDALEKGGDLGQCIVAIEDAAKRNELGWLRKPLGKVIEDGEFGSFVPIDEECDVSTSQADCSTPIDGINGVPTYGEDPITSTEKFLKQYKEVMEKKLEKIEEELEEMDSKASNN